MPVRLPRALARSRAGKFATHKVMGVWAPYLPPWAVVIHRGRKSGREYRTPLWAFRHDDKIVIVLTYGETDWLRNILAAGGGGIIRRGRRWAMANPRVVQADRVGELSAGLRMTTRVFGECMIADLRREPAQ